MTIAVILRDKGSVVTSVASDARVGDVVRVLAENRIGAVPVMSGERVIGIASERDIIRVLAERGAGVLDESVTTLMTADVRTARPDDPILGALSIMTRARVRHLPVIDGERLVGIVSIGDLVKHRIDRIEAEAAALRDYITHG